MLPPAKAPPGPLNVGGGGGVEPAATAPVSWGTRQAYQYLWRAAAMPKRGKKEKKEKKGKKDKGKKGALPSLFPRAPQSLLDFPSIERGW